MSTLSVGAPALLYAGRRRDVETPSGSVLLNDWEVLPARLRPMLDAAGALAILDPMSFPFEALGEQDRSIPLAVHLPEGWTGEEVLTLLGNSLLEHLTPFDAVSVLSGEVWSSLRTRYSWPTRMRIPEPGVVAFVTDCPLESAADSRRRQKDMHRLLRNAAQHQLSAARRAMPKGESKSALVFAEDIEQWASLFSIAQTRLVGVSFDPGKAQFAGRSFPEWEFRSTLPNRASDAETVHIALSVLSLSVHERPERLRRLARLLHPLRVGGRLIVVESFFDGYAARSVGIPTPRELLGDIREASVGHVVLEHVESLRPAGDDLISTGLFVFTKLGIPERL